MYSPLSHFLSAIGTAVLNSFWQMALLWLVVVAISKSRKNISSAALSNLGFVALLTGFVAFIITFTYSFTSDSTGFVMATGMTGKGVKIFFDLSAAIYLVLLIVSVIRFAGGITKVYTIRKHGLGRIPGPYKIFLLDAVNYLGIKKKVMLWTSDLVESPLTVGFFKPIILIPTALINNLTTRQVEAIILHELEHIRRHDYLVNFISQLIGAILYFNPFVKYLIQIQTTEREKTADQQVLQFEYSNQMYATTLLNIARQNNAVRLKLALQATGSKSQLYNRVQWIMGLRKRSIPSAKKIMASVCFTVLLFGLSRINQTGIERLATVPAVGNIEFSSISRFAGKMETAESSDAFSVKQIPVIIEEEVPEKGLVYLKQVENPETGKIEIVKPSEPVFVPAFVFAGEPGSQIPVLAKEQEQKVQEYISMLKKIAAENNWKQINQSLAESVTTEQKSQLKEVYLLMMQTTDWSAHANKLRLLYDDIDWDKVDGKLNAEVANIKLDSIYHHYTAALEKYESIKKQTELDTSVKLNVRILEAQKILKIADSIRKKRIVEL